MPIWIAFVVFAAVHLLSLYLLRASGTWELLFGEHVETRSGAEADPLLDADGDWIDNHSFWTLDADPDEGPADADDATAFWGTGHSEAG